MQNGIRDFTSGVMDFVQMRKEDQKANEDKRRRAESFRKMAEYNPEIPELLGLGTEQVKDMGTDDVLGLMQAVGQYAQFGQLQAQQMKLDQARAQQDQIALINQNVDQKLAHANISDMIADPDKKAEAIAFSNSLLGNFRKMGGTVTPELLLQFTQKNQNFVPSLVDMNKDGQPDAMMTSAKSAVPLQKDSPKVEPTTQQRNYQFLVAQGNTPEQATRLAFGKTEDPNQFVDQIEDNSLKDKYTQLYNKRLEHLEYLSTGDKRYRGNLLNRRQKVDELNIELQKMENQFRAKGIAIPQLQGMDKPTETQNPPEKNIEKSKDFDPTGHYFDFSSHGRDFTQ